MEHAASGWVTFSAHRIGDEELTTDLAAAGLWFDRWLTEDHAWFTARPA
ncbi:hypothetical protein HC031_14465 [Planosporangium thailandense]|uniref:Uncharacterized protein n=1 Tax=Planosporangium thailandense TaxID=765197 RepID=A0ABX0Y0E5_9ACTN|nr:hypothetical protein [Planosporangium thailandense]NJC70910.1 hypothetical protein [Planosporangium thailandense]